MAPDICPSLALLSEGERTAVDQLYVRMPNGSQFVDSDEQLMASRLAFGMKVAKLEPMAADVLPVALMAIFVKSVESLAHKGAPAGTGLARHLAALINDVALHHPELVTLYGAWQLQSGTWSTLPAFLANNNLCPDPARLSPAAVQLLDAGLQKHGVRSMVGSALQHGSLFTVTWLASFPGVEPIVAKELLTTRAQSRLMDLASSAPLQITPTIPVAKEAQELLGRLASGVVRARGSAGKLDVTIHEEAALKSLLEFDDAGTPLASFARQLAFNVARRRWSPDCLETVPVLSRLCGLTPAAGAARFGAELCGAIAALAAETTLWSSDAANFTSPNAHGQADRRDFITKTLEVHFYPNPT